MSESDQKSAGQPRTAGAGQARTTGPSKEEIPAEEQVFYCDLCGNQMLNLHCKLVCEQCGYKRDCSDP